MLNEHVLQKKKYLFIPILLFMIVPAFSQEKCEVLLKPIADQYEGDCKKGLAEGTGTAKGTDTYTGAFKKGVPNGIGTYTSANGDVYEGEFKKGQKNGPGKMVATVNGVKVTTTGYWNDDEYIGTNSTPYKVYQRTAGVLSVNLKKRDSESGDRHALYIEFLHKGRNISPPDFTLNESVGMISNRFTSGRETKIVIAKFPIRFQLSYMGETVDIEVSQEASWTIRLDYNK